VFISTIQVKKSTLSRGSAATKMGILTRIIEVYVFLKESFKFAKMYIVGSSERLFINQK